MPLPYRRGVYYVLVDYYFVPRVNYIILISLERDINTAYAWLGNKNVIKTFPDEVLQKDEDIVEIEKLLSDESDDVSCSE